jgi:hypothetical protein
MTATRDEREDHTPSPQATALHVVILELAIAGWIVLGKDLMRRSVAPTPRSSTPRVRLA